MDHYDITLVVCPTWDQIVLSEAKMGVNKVIGLWYTSGCALY